MQDSIYTDDSGTVTVTITCGQVRGPACFDPAFTEGAAGLSPPLPALSALGRPHPPHPCCIPFPNSLPF